ncbi:hypothetical protein QAD02_018163 [Eretmocerus hayati]|uniref:Uncharacterized protein n=1 Tax=Eretmocerus hayati TaxID=131215 RepID=A0ACC2PFW1_9HYME|nr:hypothetical protein QAD02_018163 [Eretmocerus hayati]
MLLIFIASPTGPEAFGEFYCRCPKLLMKSLGLWPSQSLWKKRIGFLIYVTYLSSVLIPQVLFIIQDRGRNFDALLENIGSIAILINGIVQCATLRLNGAKFQELYTRSVKNWQLIKDKEEKEILTKYVRIASLVGVIFTGYVTIGITVTPLMMPTLSVLLDHYQPKVNDTHKYPFFFADYVFFDQNEYFWFSWLHMNLAYILQFFLSSGFRLLNYNTYGNSSKQANIGSSPNNIKRFDLKQFVVQHNRIFR